MIHDRNLIGSRFEQVSAGLTWVEVDVLKFEIVGISNQQAARNEVLAISDPKVFYTGLLIVQTVVEKIGNEPNVVTGKYDVSGGDGPICLPIEPNFVC